MERVTSDTRFEVLSNKGLDSPNMVLSAYQKLKELMLGNAGPAQARISKFLNLDDNYVDYEDPESVQGLIDQMNEEVGEIKAKFEGVRAQLCQDLTDGDKLYLEYMSDLMYEKTMEGMSTFMQSLEDKASGIAMMIANAQSLAMGEVSEELEDNQDDGLIGEDGNPVPLDQIIV